MVLREIEAFDVNEYKYLDDIGDVKSFEYDEISVCPSCHHAFSPQRLVAFYTTEERFPSQLSVLLFCQNCKTTILCQYRVDSSLRAFAPPFCVVPKVHRGTIFMPEIQTLSPDFVETFNQSEAAESQQLLQVCGAGYRRSVEFLVKDYLIRNCPDEEEEIKAEFLGNSIKRIDDHRIKTLAERTTWLGNDETHYVKKHDDRDIEDMKRFIHAMVLYIEADFVFEDALAIKYKK